jgi:ABC-type nitrate/sulfonate/bicarbonate transport system substrate-binding protein
MNRRGITLAAVLTLFLPILAACGASPGGVAVNTPSGAGGAAQETAAPGAAGTGAPTAAAGDLQAPRIAYTSPTLPSYVNTKVGPIDFGPRFGLNFSDQQLITFDSHATATQTVLSGRADIVAGSTASHILLQQQGRDFKIFVPFLGTDDFVLAVNEKVKSPNDLFKEGVRVSTDSAGGAGYLIMQAFLDGLNTGKRVADIPSLVTLESSGQRTTALANGDVDASVIHINQFEEANEAQGGKLRTLATLYETVPHYLKESFAAPKEWLDAHQEEACALAAAVLSADRELMKNFDYYRESVGKIVEGGGPEEAELRTLHGLIRQYPFWGVNGELLESDNVGFMIDLMKRTEMLSRDVSVEQAVDRRPIQCALQRIGEVPRSELVGETGTPTAPSGEPTTTDAATAAPGP